MDDYFQGYIERLPHPRMAATGTEGGEWAIHTQPYVKKSDEPVKVWGGKILSQAFIKSK